MVVVTTSQYGTGLGVLLGRNEAGEVGHVRHQDRADRVRDLAEALEVELARIRRPAGEDQLGPRVLGEPLELVHVEPRVLLADAVGHDVEVEPGEVDLHPVREVTAVVELHAEDAVARLEQRHVGGRVCLGAGVRLHVHVLGAEELLGAVDGELLRHVDVLAAAVVALARIPLGVLVREHRALAVEDRLRNEVLGGDHLERRLLPGGLVPEDVGDLRIDVGDRLGEVVGGELAHLGDRTSTIRGHRGSLSPGTAPSRRISNRPVLVVGRQVHDRRGRSWKLAAVEDQVDAGADALVDVVDAPRVRFAGSVRARLEDGPAHLAQRRERSVSFGTLQAQHVPVRLARQWKAMPLVGQ